MKELIIIYIILLGLTSIKTIIRILKSNRFIIKNKSIDAKPSNHKIKVIIPAMNEVDNVEKSILYFKNLQDICDVIYVTTSKETSHATYDALNKNKEQYNTRNIIVINCPNTVGTMANQINYAAKTLDGENIIALYNIDSFPERKTFNYVLNNIKENTILQQVSYFDDHLSGIIKSAQNWQNRWSLSYEMGKYLNNKKLEFKYTIGHGMFIYKRLFDKYGYWSEDEINEDNELGYRMLINNIKIKPIPFMEQAGFAKNTKIYVKQQSTWVNGPLYAFNYYKKNKKSFKNLILSALNFKAFLSWWLFPLINLIFIILSMFVNYKLTLIILLLTIIYVSFGNYLAYLTLKTNDYLKQKYNYNIISDLLFFIIHSFGSYITLYKLLTGKNNIKNKYNTEK